MAISALETSTQSLSVLILTWNEEANLAKCLVSLDGLNCRVFVIDSGSQDRTVEIARRFGAQLLCHPFRSHAEQWKWALQNIELHGDWVLGLDADQSLTPELREEIAQLLRESVPDDVAGYFIKRRQIFRGKWIRHGGYYPKYLLKLFRHSRVWMDERDLVDHHFRVDGLTRKLQYDLLEDNRNEYDLSAWVEKHNRYALRQAREEFIDEGGQDGRLKASFLGSPDERTLWLKSWWRRMPLFFRPCFYFLYRYFLRLGFLDGKQGFIFHFLQGFWYRFLVDVHLDEMKKSSSRTVLAPESRVNKGHLEETSL